MPSPRPETVTAGFGDLESQAALLKRLALWGFPLVAVVAGLFLPLALVVYWVGSNAWTSAQQHYVNRKLDRDPLRR